MHVLGQQVGRAVLLQRSSQQPCTMVKQTATLEGKNFKEDIPFPWMPEYNISSAFIYHLAPKVKMQNKT